MRTMRDIINLLEGSFPTTNNDEMAGKIMSLMGILQGMGFEFKADWVADSVDMVKQAKLETEHDEAEQRLRDGTGEDKEEDETEEGEDEEVTESEEPAESAFDAKGALAEAADKVFGKGSHASGILADVVTKERLHRDSRKVDPDNLGGEDEETTYLACMNAQRELVGTFESVTPSKPSTYKGVIEGIDDVLSMIGKDNSDEKPEFVDAIRKELEYLLPLMRFCLNNL